ncbi:hypothetical protein PIB30_020064 [Stylosanthes scabra]|uniref:Late embryogenesis abundant protein LEA-2 subgroup domain-containing protein n=1 Tax=Stylosanthes scabra TaxID=79078 RepID=A0ABU6UA98_9FABA|nr:hypothetical protein [Stylosanthes scabra]
MASKKLKICMAVSALFLIIVIAVIIALIFTVFKIKQPVVSVYPTGLRNLSFSNLSLTVSIPTLITITNPNHGDFRYVNSTGYVNYDGNVVAEIPLVTNSVPARSKINISTTAEFNVSKFIEDQNFWVDVMSGTLNLTSNTVMPGKATILKFIKLKATTYSSCDISLHIISKHVESNCVTKIKL